MLTEEIGFKMEVLEDGQIQVCRVTHITRDGVEIAKTHHRHVLAPGDDTKGQDIRVAAVAAAAWTQDTIDKYKAAQSEIRTPQSAIPTKETQ